MRYQMAIHVLMLLLLLAVKVHSQDRTTFMRIDCGAASSYYADDGTYWEADENYVQSGTNRTVSKNSLNSITQLNTLRVFTKGTRDCYILPTPSSLRYFIKAAFYYGNYDGHSKGPTFDLEFNGNKWATIETTSTTIQYQEVIHTARGKNVSVCLVRTGDKQFPFISTLEIWPLAENMYDGMDRKQAWIKSYRYNYGAEQSQWILGYPDDPYNRVWEPNIPAGLLQVRSPASSIKYTSVNVPPEDAITSAVEAPELLESINLQFTFPMTSGLIYTALYFTEVTYLDENDTRYIDVYVNGKLGPTVIPELGNCSGVLATVPSNGTLLIQLKANENSTQPPVISAIEVYTATSDEDQPNLPSPKKKKNLALIIGLPVGLFLGLLLVIALILFLKWRKSRPIQGQAGSEAPNQPQNGQAQMQAKPQDGSISTNSIASTQGLLHQPPQNNAIDNHNQTFSAPNNTVASATSQPPQPNNQPLTALAGSAGTVAGNVGSGDQAVPTPRFNQEELDQLLELHNNKHASSQ